MDIDKSKVKTEMARKSLTCVKLAKQYGCSNQRIYNIMRTGRVNTETAGKLANAIGCDVRDIIAAPPRP